MISPDLRSVRAALGLSAAQIAPLLGLGGARAAATVREIERGTRPVTGPLAVLLAHIALQIDGRSAAAVLADLRAISAPSPRRPGG